MKRVIVSSKQARELEEVAKENATCPECGVYSMFGFGTCYTKKIGNLFNRRYVEVSEYSCRNCGCVWEVE